jgi:hypothetical protein
MNEHKQQQPNETRLPFEKDLVMSGADKMRGVARTA